MRDHLKAGLTVYSLTEPALTIHDNLDKVRSWGVRIVTERPDEPVAEVRMGDVDLETLARALSLYDVPLPPATALALQDHGFSPNASNRLTRFAQWQRFLGRRRGHCRPAVPPRPGKPEADWSRPNIRPRTPFSWIPAERPCAGAMLDEFATAHLAEGLLIVNAGNEHTVAALVRERKVWGV